MPQKDTGSVSVSTHILPTSANLVGACVCGIPLVKLLPRSGLSEWIDEGLLLASLCFVISVWLSYTSIRATANAEKLELRAERMFLIGLSAVFVSLAGLAFSMS